MILVSTVYVTLRAGVAMQGQAGNAVQYVTRNQAIKKLQLKLSEFRRLCILKGIHPREPKKKTQGAHKTYYHVKDIAFLLHEPMLDKIREIAAHEKKIKRALAKKNRPLAQKISSRRPEYRLDHLVKERYPSLIDALRDLDDALAMIHLFAVLPADQLKGIAPERVQLARRLALEWQAYIVASHTLRKSFVSVKGFYYQADIKGQTVTWMVPHQVSQVLPPDVDFKVMMTFLEFHQSTLQFVMFSLYNEMGIHYPPNVDDAVDSAGILSIGDTSKMIEEVKSEKRASSTIKKLSDTIATLEHEIKDMNNAPASSGATSDSDVDDLPEIDGDSDKSEESDDESDEEASDPEEEDIPVYKAAGDREEKKGMGDSAGTDLHILGGAFDVADEDSICSSLFKGMKFFLGREVPREQLSLVIQSFGGVVGWDGEGSPFDEMDERITHQVIDRPKPLINHQNRIFIQPQWIFDSSNARVLVKTTKYAPGVVPPPHLSPFVQPTEDEHVPEYAKEIQQLKDVAQKSRLRASGEAIDDEFLGKSKNQEEAAKDASLAELEQQHAEELAKEIKEATGKDVDHPTKPSKRVREGDFKDDEEALKDIMMTRKVRRAYQKAMQEKASKRAKTARLAKKAAALKTT